MPLLLHIDTATEYAGVCLSRDGKIVSIRESIEQKNHASFVQPAIRDLLSSSAIDPSSIDAIAVTAGPGSYTGLRVALASAKGLCYVWKKPLILVNTLEVMAQALIGEMQNLPVENPVFKNLLFCPMIEARRMEVFAAVYDRDLQKILPPSAIVLNELSFADILSTHKIIFGGSGHIKMKEILRHPNVIFSAAQHHASDMILFAERAFENQQFADIAYAEPFYLKEFFTPVKK